VTGKDRGGELILIAHDTSTWTREDTEEFVRRWSARMAWECRGEPGPLPIDGREYHRRQQARKRRRRHGR
jgi:hypothetical protein